MSESLSVQVSENSFSEVISEPSVQQAPMALAAQEQEKTLQQGTPAPLDIQAYEQEFAENGKLSDASYQQLHDVGIQRDVVDRYIKAQQDVAEHFVSEMKTLAGGEEGYAAMTEWASNNLSEQEVAAFNRTTSSGDDTLIRMAITGLHARYLAAEGKNPDLFSGKAASAPGVHNGRFRSTREVVEAMRDERYGTDPAYTRDVERRIARSNVF